VPAPCSERGRVSRKALSVVLEQRELHTTIKIGLLLSTLISAVSEKENEPRRRRVSSEGRGTRFLAAAFKADLTGSAPLPSDSKRRFASADCHVQSCTSSRCRSCREGERREVRAPEEGEEGFELDSVKSEPTVTTYSFAIRKQARCTSTLSLWKIGGHQLRRFGREESSLEGGRKSKRCWTIRSGEASAT
jgi:hypothetical protein